MNLSNQIISSDSDLSVFSCYIGDSGVGFPRLHHACQPRHLLSCCLATVRPPLQIADVFDCRRLHLAPPGRGPIPSKEGDEFPNTGRPRTLCHTWHALPPDVRLVRLQGQHTHRLQGPQNFPPEEVFSVSRKKGQYAV